MEKFLLVFNWIGANYQLIIAAVVAILTGVISISMIIPGDQPEKALQAVVDFISKFSKKA